MSDEASLEGWEPVVGEGVSLADVIDHAFSTSTIAHRKACSASTEPTAAISATARPFAFHCSIEQNATPHSETNTTDNGNGQSRHALRNRRRRSSVC